MTIGLDIMGGDYAPVEAMKGVKSYLSGSSSPVDLLLIGDEIEINRLIREYDIPTERTRIVHSEETIDMDDSPTKALREKPKSSIAIGFNMLASDKMDAFISAGNTGAMLVGALFSIKVLEGVIRPAISTIVPQANGSSALLLDVGLNADCKPEQLNQFAIMGSVYAQLILDIADPKVALLNVGEEEGKGNLLAQTTYPLLKENRHIHFIGNIEGRDILQSKADVMVCEGFTGNIVLKMAESLYEIGRDKNISDPFFGRFNFENYGGTPVLGISKPVIIGHGISGSTAFMNMIKLAQVMLEKNVMQKMKEELS